MRLSAIVLSVINGALPAVPKTLIDGTRSIIKGLYSEVATTLENKQTVAPLFIFTNLTNCSNLDDNETLLKRLILQRVAGKINHSQIPVTAGVYAVFSTSTLNLSAMRLNTGLYKKNVIQRSISIQIPDDILTGMESAIDQIFKNSCDILRDHPHSHIFYGITLHDHSHTVTALQSLIAQQVVNQLNTNGIIAQSDVIEDGNAPTVVTLAIVNPEGNF